MEKETESQLGYPIENIRDLDLKQVKKLITKDVENNLLIHGTNWKEPLPEIEPRQGHDTERESGRKLAVYATDNIPAALTMAIVDRQFMSSRYDSYVTGFGTADGNFTLNADSNIYELIKSNYDDCFSDGFVYVFDRKNFRPSEGTNSEFQSEVAQKPIKAYQVSAKLAEEMFKIGETILKYND